MLFNNDSYFISINIKAEDIPSHKYIVQKAEKWFQDSLEILCQSQAKVHLKFSDVGGGSCFFIKIQSQAGGAHL